MAAKKKSTGRAKAVRRVRPVPQPENTPEPPIEATAAPVSKTERRTPPVAGIGASAGGLDAFKKFFAAMPADSGIAFVLVPHLDPGHESFLVDLLAKQTAMPVSEAKNHQAVEANHIYIIPPNKYMTIQGGVLHLTGPVERQGSQTTIDLFLRSLADDQQERSICIILSGTGSHGTLGLKAIKAAGGVAMVQDPATAANDRMPQSAVATGLADFILPVEKMPAVLAQYVRHGYVNGDARTEAAPEAADHLTEVLALLRARARFDFRAYRKNMLRRRVERRMGLNHIDSMHAYLAFLRNHPAEVTYLAKDLFVNVTSFFRDREAFELLASQVIAPLVQRKQANSVIRVWVPGCATGEEPYSIAMLLLEQLAAAHKTCRVQIFATDVDEGVLAAGRQGIYPSSIEADVSPERLARFFTRVDEHTFQVTKQVREPVVFAMQNLISDAPFTRLDLISCRNLLIYLEPDVQKKVLSLFHFTLNAGGALFLGSSETVGRQVDQFEPLSKKWRIYRRIGLARPDRIEFPIAPRTAAGGIARGSAESGEPRTVDFAGLTQRLLLKEFAPAAVLINRKHEILYYSGGCSKYFEFPTGEPTQDLVRMAREELRALLRSAVHRAIRDNERVALADIPLKRDGHAYSTRVTVEPVHPSEMAEGLLLITFEDKPSRLPALTQPASAAGTAPDESTVHQLERELEATREDLQGSIEELETSNEELQSSNEEMLSMNEELQSSNEELESSKEELQSLNEELSTVNTQLGEKVSELEKANNDLANLLNCTDIPTVFLDRQLRIKLFTPTTTRLFNFITSDVGRSFRDFTPKFIDPELYRDAEETLRDFVAREKEVCVEAGRWYVRSIVPYRTLDNRVDGVVMTFVDITERKKSSDQVVRRLAAIVQSSADAVFSKDLKGAILTWNRGAERLYGYAPEEAIGRSVEMLVPEDRAAEWATIMTRLKRGEHVERLDTERVRKDGRRVTVSLTISPITDSDGKLVSASIIARDVSERKQAEEMLRASEERFRLMADHAPVLIWMSGIDKGCTWFNKPWLDFTGHTMDEEIGEGWLRGVHEQDRDRCLQTYISHFDAMRPFSMEYRLRRHDGEYRWLLDTGLPLFGAGAEFSGYIGSCIDITDRKQTEMALLDRQGRLEAILNTAADAIITIDYHGIIQTANAAAESMFGYSAAELVGQNVKLLMPLPYQNQHDAYIARYLHTGKKHIIGLNRETVARRKDGSIFPTDLAVSEIPGLKLFTGIHRDLSERKKLERDIVETASLTQRRIGQDLHDTVAQELTALTLLAGELADSVGVDPANASALIEQMKKGLQRSRTQLRAVLHGLLPVAVDAEGLMAALADLASRTRQDGKVACAFDCPEPVSVTDNLTATHLYLIAQEAVQNALKHGKPRTIRIGLQAKPALVLEVQCDGIGMPAGPLPMEGLGIRVMRSRAAIIDADLMIEPAEPSGTLVRCTLRRQHNGATQKKETKPGPHRR